MCAAEPYRPAAVGLADAGLGVFIAVMATVGTAEVAPPASVDLTGYTGRATTTSPPI